MLLHIKRFKTSIFIHFFIKYVYSYFHFLKLHLYDLLNN